MKRSTYFLLGLLMTGTGILGAFLPVLPSTCFFIFAAYFFSQSSERMEKWIIEHPIFGPSVKGWRENRSIPKNGKIAAVAGMSFSAALIVWSQPPPLVLVGCLAALLLSAIYVVSRKTLRT